MNTHPRITEASDSNMTSKGQVLIPKAVRERVGLRPGAPVIVGVNDRGEVVISPKSQRETREERVARLRTAIESVAGTLKSGFASTDEHMTYLRPWRNDPL